MSFGDPGYLYTAKLMAAAAMALLGERATCLASVGGAGGVYTAGFLLRDTSIVDRLKADGFKFEVEHVEEGEGAGVVGGGVVAHA